MSNILLKYNLLDKTARNEVMDFMDFLLSRNKAKKMSISQYKNKIRSVSVWSDEDIKIFDKNRKLLNQWKAEE